MALARQFPTNHEPPSVSNNSHHLIGGPYGVGIYRLCVDCETMFQDMASRINVEDSEGCGGAKTSSDSSTASVGPSFYSSVLE